MDDITPDAGRPPQPPPLHRSLPFVRPADYYASPERVRLFPRWVPFGCGTLSIVFLLIFFAAGAMVASGKAGSLIDRACGMMQSDVDSRFAKNVPRSDRAEFDAQMNALRAKIRSGHVKLEALRPLLREINQSASDGDVSPQDAKRLIEAARVANGAEAK